jgi:2-hydroxychromene-2-carboxylate isomerase
VYRANFAEDRDISDPVVVSECLAGIGQDAAACMAEANADASKQRLRAQNERALALGIFGAPTFVVGTELFWGNDRLESAIAWWRAHAST